MPDDIKRLQQELDELEKAIATQEALRGILPDVQVEAMQAPLQQKAAELRTAITVAGNVTNSNLIVGHWNRVISNVTNFFGGSTEQQRAQRNRRIMLERVKEFWIKDVFENSLHDQALIELGMAERPEAVDNRPWDMVLQTPERPPRQLPHGTKMVDVFDEMKGTLLILGEPGSGKTTMLLELARSCLARAENDPILPIPVVFNLSSWANSPLAEWLIDELKVKYLIPKKIARPWVENDELLPLLDGLDEVALERREGCVQAINQFRQEYLMPLVVCSRIADYEALTRRLKLQGAVLLQPLTPPQIEAYLARAGDELSAVRETLQHDSILQELAQSPLMLSIMVLAYRGMSVDQLKMLDTLSARRQHIFYTYVERIFKRKDKKKPPYTKEQTEMWLSWLAQNMNLHSQKLFLIEQLQPSWLATRRERWFYGISSRLIGGLVLGLSMGGIFGYMVGTIDGLTFGLINGLIGGFIAGVFDVSGFERRGKLIGITSTLWLGVFNILGYWIILGLINGLIFELIDGPIVGVIDGPISGLIAGPNLGLIGGVIFGVMVGLRGRKQSVTSDIQTVETLSWSWAGAWLGGICGLIAGLGMGLIFGLSFQLIIVLVSGVNLESIWNFAYKSITQRSPGLINALDLGRSCMLIGGLIGTLLGGLNGDVIKTKTSPNQGIKPWIKNAIFGGGIVGLAVGLSAALIWPQNVRVVWGLEWNIGLVWGFIVALLGGLWYGGLDVIQHYTLRFILYVKGYTPRNYAHFLDYAAKLIFLQKVGGGYIFIHRLLLEHFVAMKESE